MFVQSAGFVERHKKNPTAEISVYGQEKVAETVRLCKMNLAVHGLAGDIRQGNSYYEDLHNSVDTRHDSAVQTRHVASLPVGKFDFVMANPPFNVDKVDKEKLKDAPRFPFGLPKADNANYLWIQEFYSALNAKGRAGFVSTACYFSGLGRACPRESWRTTGAAYDPCRMKYPQVENCMKPPVGG